MLPASKAPFPWLIVFFRKIESGFIWERGGVGKKAPTDEPTRKPVGAKGWVGLSTTNILYPLNTLPQARWRMEEGMNTIEIDRLLCKRGVLRCLLS